MQIVSRLKYTHIHIHTFAIIKLNQHQKLCKDPASGMKDEYM